jgi:hypothetical protein
MRILVVILMGLMLGGCATCFPDIGIQQAENQGRLYIGMDLSEVETIVGNKPECIYADRCMTEHLPDADYFVWVVNGGQGGTNFMKTYYFRFKDRKLTSWGNE